MTLFSPPVLRQIETYRSRRVCRLFSSYAVAGLNFLTCGYFWQLYCEAILAETAIDAIMEELTTQPVAKVNRIDDGEDPDDEPTLGHPQAPEEDDQPERTEELHFASAQNSFNSWLIQVRSLTGCYFALADQWCDCYDAGMSPADTARAYQEEMSRRKAEHRDSIS
jgi:hypothetical protein